MIDARISFQVLDPELKGNSEFLASIKDLFSSSATVERTDGAVEIPQAKNYELDQELSEDLKFVKGAAEGLEPLGDSVEHRSSEA